MQALKKTKQEVVAEFRSAEILEAARRVFARKGFEGASVDEIAEAAGLAKGTVYVYFHSKRELYLAALKQGLAALMTETGRNMDAAPTAAEKIRAFMSTRIRYAEAHRDFFALYQAEFGNIHPACLGRVFKNLYQQQLQAVETALDQGLADHEIRSVPRDAAAFMVCEMTRAWIGRRLLGWSRATADEDVDFLFDLIWKGLAAGSGRARPGDVSWIVH
ncbi:MAG: TetR/AcrR family transcriptional regulator [Acidobacteriia bacterium]|nr:TetR/AcrR family transcriptional regulator [Terriglobia bacterium]